MNYMISQEFHEKSKVYTSPDILKLLKLHVLFDADFDFLQYLSSDIAELQKRQTIFKDLIRHPSLAEQLGRLFDLLQTVDAMNFKADEKPTDLFKCMTIFSDFPKVFASVAQEIQQAGHSLQSDCFLRLERLIGAAMEPLAHFGDMERAAAHLDFPKSITYKIRLNDELKIKEVGLCKINSQFFSNRSKRDRIIKWNDIASQKYRANSFFSKKMKTEEETPGAIELLLLSQEEPKLLFTDEPSAIAKDIQALLIDALDQVLHTQSNSLLSRIKAFRALIKQHFGLLHKELAFLIKGLQMIQRLNREHESSFPQLVSAEERTFIVNNAFHPALALNGPVVFNPVNLNQWGDVLLLSGINTGGKTTYLQTVGSIQLLAQLGLPVPGTDPVISVAENIVLAFSVNETAENHQGRLHQELQILKEAAIHIGPNSFFLFNEPLTGSSPMVCAQIMNEILSIVKVLNGRGVWVSHLTSSVEKFERFNQRLPGSRIGSIYVALDHGAPDYHIHAGLPPKNNYATQLFDREHGNSR